MVYAMVFCRGETRTAAGVEHGTVRVLEWSMRWCSVGVRHGLQLVLNMEQYEYLNGLCDGVL